VGLTYFSLFSFHFPGLVFSHFVSKEKITAKPRDEQEEQQK
jgi:hypothetical protein